MSKIFSGCGSGGRIISLGAERFNLYLGKDWPVQEKVLVHILLWKVSTWYILYFFLAFNFSLKNSEVEWSYYCGRHILFSPSFLPCNFVLKIIYIYWYTDSVYLLSPEGFIFPFKLNSDGKTTFKPISATCGYFPEGSYCQVYKFKINRILNHAILILFLVYSYHMNLTLFNTCLKWLSG